MKKKIMLLCSLLIVGSSHAMDVSCTPLSYCIDTGFCSMYCAPYKSEEFYKFKHPKNGRNKLKRISATLVKDKDGKWKYGTQVTCEYHGYVSASSLEGKKIHPTDFEKGGWVYEKPGVTEMLAHCDYKEGNPQSCALSID